MKLLRRRRWLVAGFTGTVMVAVYFLAQHISEQHPDVAPAAVMRSKSITDSYDADEYYEESDGDSAGGSLLFPVRDRLSNEWVPNVAIQRVTASAVLSRRPPTSVRWISPNRRTSNISDTELSGGSTVSQITRTKKTFGVKMLTDDPRTMIEMPWKETRQLLERCALLGDEYYYSLGDLPTASVIVTFHSGETWYNLLHTLHSIFQRTPPSLLHEVILIDDFSNTDDFSELLVVYTKTVFGEKVKLHRNKMNLGLIRSRLIGSSLATGDVIIVMDSHSEVQARWLEPLLFEVKKNRKVFANSNIDWMIKEEGQWRYKYSGVGWTVYFDWRLNFGWQAISKELLNGTDITKAFSIKVNIGAYGAIDRAFFKEIGAYDGGMDLWGGENIDLSIRTWLFDGRVLSVPCSRVGHREQPGSRDYRNNYTKAIQKNYKRVVDVWLDEYSRLFYVYNPALTSLDSGDLSSRLSIKSRAHHNFTWFLQNVFPELDVFDVSSLAWGQVVNVGSELCMDYNAAITTYTCAKADLQTQMFFLSSKSELRRDMKIINVQLLPSEKTMLVYGDYMEFFGNDRGTKWTHRQGGPLVDRSTNLCLEAGLVAKPLEMKTCDPNLLTQQWNFTHYNGVSRRRLLGPIPLIAKKVIHRMGRQGVSARLTRN